MVPLPFSSTVPIHQLAPSPESVNQPSLLTLNQLRSDRVREQHHHALPKLRQDTIPLPQPPHNRPPRRRNWLYRNREAALEHEGMGEVLWQDGTGGCINEQRAD